MTIIEKYNYWSEGDIKVIRKEELNTLLHGERATINDSNTALYNELRDLLLQYATSGDIIEINTDLKGMVFIKTPANFDKPTFKYVMNRHWEGCWTFA